jgi:hypothetical protein
MMLRGGGRLKHKGEKLRTRERKRHSSCGAVCDIFTTMMSDMCTHSLLAIGTHAFIFHYSSLIRTEIQFILKAPLPGIVC